MTLPPSPPSPPEGPPRGTYFSRRKAMQPLPPSPPRTWMRASSTNMGGWACCQHRPGKRTGKEQRSGRRGRPGFDRQNVDEFPQTAFVLEPDDARHAGIERVVAPASDVQSGTIARAPLADQNAAAGYELPVKALDAEPLAGGIASVDRGTAAFFVRHGRSPSVAAQHDFVNADRGEVLPVSPGDLVLVGLLVLEDQHLAVAAMAGHRGAHPCRNHGCTGAQSTVVAHGQYLIEFHHRANRLLEPFDAPGLARRHTILLSACADNRVHSPSPGKPLF